MSGNAKNPLFTHFYVFFPAIASAAGVIIVSIYHCIIVICRARRQDASPQTPQAAVARNRSDIENFMVEITHKYEKGKGVHDGECPVCLSEFEEGEEIRTLPECMHSFHVACINMWLYSHPNCPMCRTNAMPTDARVSPLVISSSE